MIYILRLIRKLNIEIFKNIGLQTFFRPPRLIFLNKLFQTFFHLEVSFSLNTSSSSFRFLEMRKYNYFHHPQVNEELPNFSDQSMEHIINMSPVGSASFVEWTTKFLCQRLTLATVNHPHGLLQINFVSHQDDRNIL